MTRDCGQARDGAHRHAATSVSLAWLDTSGNEDGFRVERATDLGGSPGTFTEIAVLGPMRMNYERVMAAVIQTSRPQMFTRPHRQKPRSRPAGSGAVTTSALEILFSHV